MRQRLIFKVTLCLLILVSNAFAMDKDFLQEDDNSKNSTYSEKKENKQPQTIALAEGLTLEELFAKGHEKELIAKYTQDPNLKQQIYREAATYYALAAIFGNVQAQYRLGAVHTYGHGVERSFQEAIKWYEKAALQGNTWAQYNLGVMYAEAQGVKQYFEKALEWYKKAALQGHVWAQYNLGSIYAEGRGVVQSFEKALEWWQKAADQGDALAQFNLARMYASGRGVEQSDEKAVEWYRRAADQGDAEAQYNLGLMYDEGRGVERSYEKAAEWYERAAKQGFAPAQFQLARSYDIIFQDKQEAFKWYMIAANLGYAPAQNKMGRIEHLNKNYNQALFWYMRATEQEYPEAYLNLGYMFLYGHGVIKSETVAFSWFQKAAKRGHPEAQFNLGVAYHNGEGIGKNNKKSLKWTQRAAQQGHLGAQYNLRQEGVIVAKNEKEDLEWYQKAAEKGLTVAMRYLAQKFLDGSAVFRDEKQAFVWCLKAAERADPFAQFQVGMMYQSGVGVVKHAQEAVKWYRKAAAQGLAEAQMNLGTMLLLGHGTSKDEKEAFYWMKKAASQGDVIAQNKLGGMYESGMGIVKNEQKAVKWKQISAAQGYYQAQFDLALAYMEGRGIDKNEELGIEWCRKAAEKGYPLAQSLLGKSYEEGKGVPKNKHVAVRWYKKAAEQGNPIAQLSLGIMLSKGQGMRQSNKEAVEWFQKATKQKKENIEIHHIYTTKAYKNLSTHYYSGQGVLKNEKKALLCLVNELHLLNEVEAIENLPHGHPKLSDDDYQKERTFFELYKSKENSHSIEDECFKILSHVRNSAKEEMLLKQIVADGPKEKLASQVASEYEKAAKEGKSDAQLKLGLLYYYGLGIRQDHMESFEWYGEAAQRGNADAQDLLAQLLRDHSGVGDNSAVTKDKLKDVRWSLELRINKLKEEGKFPLTADRNDLLLYAVEDIRKHPNFSFLKTYPEVNKIRTWIERAAFGDKVSLQALIEQWHKGNSIAMLCLVKLYAHTWIERLPATTDHDILQWLSKAAGVDDDPRIQYRLGRMYEYGWGTPKDEKAAFLCFEKGAKEYWYAPAQKALAEMYLSGEVVPQSKLEAIRWYRRAGKEGDAGASAAIKEMADENYAPALYALGRAHEEGWGIARDEDEAMVQYEASARQGYFKGQHAIAVRQLEGKTALKEELNPLELLTTLSGEDARKTYLRLLGRKFDRKEKKRLKALHDQGLPEPGYYRAQHKLAELYETGQVFSLKTIKDMMTSYTEAIRLYELTIQSNKPVAMTPLERVRSSLETLEKMSHEGRIRIDHPEFSQFLEEEAEDKKFGPEFLYQLAFLFTEANTFTKDISHKLKKMIRLLITLPESSRQTQSILHMVTTLVHSKEFKEGLSPSQEGSDAYRLKSLSSLEERMELIRHPWRLIPVPSTLSGPLRISKALLRDPRIEMFNSYFKYAETPYDPELFKRSVSKILDLFDRLKKEGHIKNPFLYSEDDNDYGTRKTLEKLLTHNYKPNNRFGHRLIRIADIVYEQFKKDLPLVASQLIQWAKRGLNCLTASEEEMNRFYIDYITNTKTDSGALTKEDRTLEMQVALSLAKLRYRILDEIVEEKDEQRIHCVKHLEKKAKIALSLLGDAENYTDESEFTIPSKYREMNTEQITTKVLERYTPTFIAQHIAKQIEGKIIDYDKIYRRLRLQYIRGKVALHGELDQSLFRDEDYLLDHCTREEFMQRTLSLNVRSNKDKKSLPDWEALKGQSYERARRQMETEFYDDEYKFTLKGAKALLKGLGYLAEDKD